MGEMSSMMGSVMQATKGPPDPGIQPTPTGGGGAYTPTTSAAASGQSPIAAEALGQSGLSRSPRLSELLMRRQ